MSLSDALYFGSDLLIDSCHSLVQRLVSSSYPRLVLFIRTFADFFPFSSHHFGLYAGYRHELSMDLLGTTDVSQVCIEERGRR